MTMGRTWQQGPLAPRVIGHFLVPDPLLVRELFAEPWRRRMRVQFAGEWMAVGGDVVLLRELGHHRNLTTAEVVLGRRQ
jgi:hypothetical protein